MVDEIPAIKIKVFEQPVSPAEKKLDFYQSTLNQLNSFSKEDREHLLEMFVSWYGFGLVEHAPVPIHEYRKNDKS